MEIEGNRKFEICIKITSENFKNFINNITPENCIPMFIFKTILDTRVETTSIDELLGWYNKDENSISMLEVRCRNEDISKKYYIYFKDDGVRISWTFNDESEENMFAKKIDSEITSLKNPDYKNIKETVKIILLVILIFITFFLVIFLASNPKLNLFYRTIITLVVFYIEMFLYYIIEKIYNYFTPNLVFYFKGGVEKYDELLRRKNTLIKCISFLCCSILIPILLMWIT